MISNVVQLQLQTDSCVLPDLLEVWDLVSNPNPPRGRLSNSPTSTVPWNFGRCLVVSGWLIIVNRSSMFLRFLLERFILEVAIMMGLFFMLTIVTSSNGARIIVYHRRFRVSQGCRWCLCSIPSPVVILDLIMSTLKTHSVCGLGLAVVERRRPPTFTKHPLRLPPNTIARESSPAGACLVAMPVSCMKGKLRRLGSALTPPFIQGAPFRTPCDP